MNTDGGNSLGTRLSGPGNEALDTVGYPVCWFPGLPHSFPELCCYLIKHNGLVLKEVTCVLK